MEPLHAALIALAAPVLVLGVLELVYYPLALAFERRPDRAPAFATSEPTVSVVVPAYNEGRVIANCVESILADGYPHKQLVLVDDGSTDDTHAVMRRYERPGEVVVLSQANAGKAAALNAGIAAAAGEVLMFVDADGIFTSNTISELLRGFDCVRTAAVCGNDEPVNLDRVQTRLLALLTHGTAFVRRALARLGCLTIVSGNLGAFRASVVREVGGFEPGFVGEDLELTWRVHRAGYRVGFRPRALVYAEVPSTLRALWRQRVRWTRGHIQTARLHRDMFLARRFGRLGLYLPLNAFAMLIVPVLQLLAAVLIGVAIAAGESPVSGTAIGILGFLGVGMALAAVTYAIWLDRAWRDLRFLILIPLWPFFSVLMSLVTVHSLALEARGAPARWNKLARTGVVSRRTLAGSSASSR
jgi:cellulose synthase/poly-beta-1,6-N-acetylglucosamine synthase-like glycosyltransferase